MKGFNIYLRKDGRWEGRITKGKDSNGKRSYHYFFAHTCDQVANKMTEFLSSVLKGNECINSFGSIYKEWFNSIHHVIKQSTAANYMMKAKKHLLPYFGTKCMSSINETSIYSFIKQKQREGLSSRYISDIIVLMKSIFKYAVKKYHIFNPLNGISLPKKKRSEVMLLDANEQNKLQTFINNNRNLSTLGTAISMTTGIRIGELCALQWSNVDFEKRVLTVKKTLQRIQNPTNHSKTQVVITEPKSDSSMRSIPIPDCLIGFLSDFKGADSEYILTGSNKPIEPRSMQYRFRTILKNAGLPSIHFHALRHMFASNCVKLGFDIKSLSELLGHSSVEITLNRYVHSSFEQKKEYMSRITLTL